MNLVLDYCPGGDLFSLIYKLYSRGKVLKRRQIQFYAACILEGLEYLHDANIIYKDLKPENVVISKEGVAKLIDFGHSDKLKRGQTQSTSTEVTRSVSAPESLRKRVFSKSSDFWSYGCFLYELATGHKAFYGQVRSD